MSRQVDLAFGAEEKLWRRIEQRNVAKRDRSIKPNSLRLQISVVREKHANRESVCHDKFNGIAETTAGEVASLFEGPITVVCIDEPTKDNDGHALIAMVLAPGDSLSDDQETDLRIRLAKSMKVVVDPT